VRQRDLPVLWQALRSLDLATPNHGMLTDLIACPGLDYCSLANARSISVAQDLQRHFSDSAAVADLGELTLNISGCMNACGHHHVGHIGILGVEKNGEEFYQLLLGGSSGHDASLGERLGPGIRAEEINGAIERLLDTYRAYRSGSERFLDTYRRVGPEPFKAAVYGDAAGRSRREVA
jgi:sulfite reductase (NADPH) hemoprotein beta-component